MPEKTGWECPRCKVINSPEKKQCSCVKSEETTQNPQELLLE